MILMSLFTVLVYCKLFMIHSPKSLAMHSNIVIYLVCACMYVFVCVVVWLCVCVCVCVSVDVLVSVRCFFL